MIRFNFLAFKINERETFLILFFPCIQSNSQSQNNNNIRERERFIE